MHVIQSICRLGYVRSALIINGLNRLWAKVCSRLGRLHRPRAALYSRSAPLTVTSAMAKQYLGATPRRGLEYLIAILFWNSIYFFSPSPPLPIVLRHQGPQLDWGMGLDFLVCVAVYG